MDANERLLRSAEELLQNRDDPRAKQAIVEAHAADLAHVLQHLPPSDRAIIFRILGPEQAGDVLSELDDATLLGLVRSLDDVEVSQILDRMPAEHAADVVDELSTEHAEKILDLMEEERSEEIQEILEYPEDSAGRLMSPDVVAVRETSTVEEAVQHIRKTVTEERPFGVYAVDDHQHLIGRVPLRRLLLADPRSLILGILDREEMARVVAKYDLVTVPVVDDQNRLIGTITVDDVIDVVEEEASEDIFRMAGSDAAELERRSPGQVAMLRLPWVMLTLLIEMLAGVVIHFFDHTLGKVILLASFMPVIQAISGNTGLQSVTMVVRGLATGQVRLSRWWEPLWRQIQTSAILGAVCAVVVGLIGLMWHSAIFGLVVATSMFVSVNLSGCAGTAIPMLSKRMGFDPALTAGPFETAFQDVLGVTIFLSLATALLHWLV